MGFPFYQSSKCIFEDARGRALVAALSRAAQRGAARGAARGATCRRRGEGSRSRCGACPGDLAEEVG